MEPLAAPLGDVIASIGRSVAGAQQTIDERVLAHFGAVYDQTVAAFEPLRAIGYQPTWYQIAEATAEMKLAITATTARDLRGTAVDARYRSRFGYSHTSASSLKVRIVPVPPPGDLG
jgi:hypothetical protein